MRSAHERLAREMYDLALARTTGWLTLGGQRFPVAQGDVLATVRGADEQKQSLERAVADAPALSFQHASLALPPGRILRVLSLARAARHLSLANLSLEDEANLYLDWGHATVQLKPERFAKAIAKPCERDLTAALSRGPCAVSDLPLAGQRFRLLIALARLRGLSVSRPAPACAKSVLRRAYRQRAFDLHPDRHGDAQPQELATLRRVYEQKLAELS